MTPRPLAAREFTLEDIARLYRFEMSRWEHEGRFNKERSPRPKQYIAEQLNVCLATAGRRIAATREAGLLGPARRTRGGEKEDT